MKARSRASDLTTPKPKCAHAVQVPQSTVLDSIMLDNGTQGSRYVEFVRSFVTAATTFFYPGWSDPSASPIKFTSAQRLLGQLVVVFDATVKDAWAGGFPLMNTFNPLRFWDINDCDIRRIQLGPGIDFAGG